MPYFKYMLYNMFSDLNYLSLIVSTITIYPDY